MIPVRNIHPQLRLRSQTELGGDNPVTSLPERSSLDSLRQKPTSLYTLISAGSRRCSDGYKIGENRQPYKTSAPRFNDPPGFQIKFVAV